MPSLGFGKGALKDWNFKPTEGFRQLEPDITDNPPPAFPGMCFVMTKVKSEPGSSDVYLWSPAPDSVDRAYHRIWGRVKSNAPTVTFWGRVGAYGIAEEAICKVVYQFGGSLGNNDKR